MQEYSPLHTADNVLQQVGYAFFQCYIFIGTALFHMAKKLLDLWSCKNQIHSHQFLEQSRQNGELLMSKKVTSKSHFHGISTPASSNV